MPTPGIRPGGSRTARLIAGDAGTARVPRGPPVVGAMNDSAPTGRHDTPTMDGAGGYSDAIFRRMLSDSSARTVGTKM